MQRVHHPAEATRGKLPDPEIVERELAAILGSAQFRGSRRCQDFLSHVVTKTLAGEADCLKERALATAVFGLKANVDLEENSIVRVGAREVCKRLAQYYMSGGSHDELWIELPSGSYVPVFQPRLGEAEVPVTAPADPVAEAAPPVSGSSLRRGLWIALGAVVLAVGAVLFS